MSTSADYRRRQIVGRGIPVAGNDIDTDRIIPARFLKEVTFETMGGHAVAYPRKQNTGHSFNWPSYRSASVVVPGQTFSCRPSPGRASQGAARSASRSYTWSSASASL